MSIPLDFNKGRNMYHVILNPVAGKKKAKKNLAITEKIFKEKGSAYEAHQTCAVHDAEDIARMLTLAGETELIVIGGDGTLHEVLNGIADTSKVKLGLIPSGTGNDFAEKAGIPEDAEKALALILDGETKETDYLEVGGKRCMNRKALRKAVYSSRRKLRKTLCPRGI